MNTHNFNGYAIKCDTWEQMEQLAQLAKAQGYNASAFSQTESTYNGEEPYFAAECFGEYKSFSTYPDCLVSDLKNIHFTTFINLNK